uniref:Clusterin-associated protein 1 n=1 Tax=Bursaphelenchus xylophilus TaxID=6326 RepID=A0A1I7RU61_BURXY
MSYRELRDAVEILRFLQYPRLISIENFRNPNFPLMAEIVEWTVKKFDPNYRVPKNIDTEQNRVLFVKSCVLALVQKARVKINPKNLYQSDGYAVRELLPVLKLLYEGNKEKITDDSQNKAQLQVLRSQITGKRQEIRDCINKVLELPQQSANLYDLLAKELVAREARTKALSQSLNVRDVEKTLKTMVQHIREQYNDIENRMKNLGSDEKGLDEKIDRRERELDQLHKRLAKLQSFRPPHMDEFERQEARLQNLYNEYILQFRNLTYLNEKLLDVERAEREKSDEAERSMRMTVEKMKDDNKRLPQLSGAEMENVKQNGEQI